MNHEFDFMKLRELTAAGTPLAPSTVLTLIDCAEGSKAKLAAIDENRDCWHGVAQEHRAERFDWQARAETAESLVEELRREHAKLIDAHTLMRNSADYRKARAEAAEAKLAQVLEVWTGYKSKLGSSIPDHYKNSIDGALTGHWMTLGSTPTGEPADVCFCGKPYWPCDSMTEHECKEDWHGHCYTCRRDMLTSEEAKSA